MAQSSGRVEATVAGTVRHATSGSTYTIDNRGLVQFGNTRKQLQWHIGSGAAGQSFVYSYDGFLYQAPVTWYTQRSAWDSSPGYEHDTTTRWNRPVDASCLFCHASQSRPIYGTENRFADPPFLQNGVACERCHGPGSDHVQGKGQLVNPAKLEPERRDGICAQCHLSGESRINKAGQSMAAYRPGDRLPNYVSFFVRDEPSRAGLKATGYVEKLQASRCKSVSGDRLWCGTCHDPHSVPAPHEVAGFFRAKCLTCHTPAQCDRGPDCRSCHMPRARAIDGGHGVLTDHSIPRRPAKPDNSNQMEWKLVAFPGYQTTPRELGLAYAELGVRTGNERQMREALRLLSGVPADRDVLPRLADLYTRIDDQQRAYQLYRQAFQLTPKAPLVLVNLGALEAERGNTARAVELWHAALDVNPGLVEAAANLNKLRKHDAAVEQARKIERGLLP